MIHGLAAVCAGVDNDAVAFSESLVARNFGRSLEEMAEEVAVFNAGIVQRGKVFAGNDEDVDGRLRMNIGEGVAQLVLIDSGRGNGAIGNFAKEAGHGVTSRARSVYNRAVERVECANPGERLVCRP
jgi:hypothetical protein